LSALSFVEEVKKKKEEETEAEEFRQRKAELLASGMAYSIPLF
jgi:hypothetical protein